VVLVRHRRWAACAGPAAHATPDAGVHGHVPRPPASSAALTAGRDRGAHRLRRCCGGEPAGSRARDRRRRGVRRHRGHVPTPVHLDRIVL